jgi:hypothetical protein
LSEKQIPQVIENLESGGEPKEAVAKAPYARKAGALSSWSFQIVAAPILPIK